MKSESRFCEPESNLNNEWDERWNEEIWKKESAVKVNQNESCECFKHEYISFGCLKYDMVTTLVMLAKVF